jgi:hypothetical protein
MIETGAAMGGHHDDIDLFLFGHLDNILERAAELDDLANLDQIDAVGKALAREFIQGRRLSSSIS